MATRELINSLPENVQRRIAELKTEWKTVAKTYGKNTLATERVETKMNGYAYGLYDAGLIKDRERAIVTIYLHTNFD